MRLPTLGEDASSIDETLAIRMMRTAFDMGVNYVDTAYPYHGGKSEIVVGKALKNGYREKVKVATKLPPWNVNTPSDLDRVFDEQREKLGVDTIDFYLLHCLNKEFWPKLKGLDIFNWAEKKKTDGDITNFGFSFHDEYGLFEEIILGYDQWDFCQIQYNYMDTEYQAGKQGLTLAAERGLGVIVMEPLKGGQLSLNPPPPPVADLWDQAEVRRTPADHALQWLWNQPEVSIVLSGMSTMEQVEQNIISASGSGVGTLTPEEEELVEKARKAFERLIPIPCTACRYCLPCPDNVAIPAILRYYNEATMYGNADAARGGYTWLNPDKKADKCIQCGECEEKCPQKIEIIKWLEKADILLS